MKHLCSILFLLALIPVQSQAQDSNGHFAIWGVGNKSCHSYNISRNTDEEQEILVWLDDYCEEKPILAFEQSLADFITENYDKRMKKAPSKFRR